MKEDRPDPQKILARVQEEESTSTRGRLKIFLGAAAGVGKTYAMLQEAQRLIGDGVDLVAGCVVTHGRKETEQLLEGLEALPEQTLEYKGTKLKEFDLDEALKRKPAIILVDELAHTNVPGARHQKRWQDVEELLDAGISVFSTLNVQHLESANDIVAQITGITVQETVPDSIFERAYEIELVDLPPDDLIQRLKEGKVYVPEQSKTALENFFRKGNLIALRELALRSAAQRVDAQMQKYRTDADIDRVWPASERIMVCVGPSPLSQRLVRAAKRMASGLHAEWMAVWVETPANERLPEKDRNRVLRNLQLAESLGAETVTLTGNKASEELVSYARQRNVSKIVIGKPARPRWKEQLFGSVVDDLIRQSGDIDVYVITGDTLTAQVPERLTPPGQINTRAYLSAVAVVALATLIVKYSFHRLASVNLVMIYQLAVVYTAVRYGKGPSILAVVLSVAAFDFFFVSPYFSFAVSDTQYLITFAVMLVVGLLLSTLTSTVKQQAESARKRERRTAALYAMTREQATAITKSSVIKTSLKHIAEVFEAETVVFLSNDSGQLAPVERLETSFAVDAKEFGVAQWAFINNRIAGHGTTTLPGGKAMYLPLSGASGTFGVIGILPSVAERVLSSEEMHLLETFVNQMAVAVERAWLSEESAREQAADK